MHEYIHSTFHFSLCKLVYGYRIFILFMMNKLYEEYSTNTLIFFSNIASLQIKKTRRKNEIFLTIWFLN